MLSVIHKILTNVNSLILINFINILLGLPIFKIVQINTIGIFSTYYELILQYVFCIHGYSSHYLLFSLMMFCIKLAIKLLQAIYVCSIQFAFLFFFITNIVFCSIILLRTSSFVIIFVYVR